MNIQFKRKTITNVLLISFILILLFTPLGFKIKVAINQLFSGQPQVLEEEKQLVLRNYDWHLVDFQGLPSPFENYRDKVLVINFWATWCPPCVAEMPSFELLYQDYGDKVGFLFIAEDDVEKVTAFIQKKGYTLPVYFSTSQAPDILISNSLPTSYIIDRKGKVIVKEIGAADWNSKSTTDILDKLLEAR